MKKIQKKKPYKERNKVAARVEVRFGGEINCATLTFNLLIEKQLKAHTEYNTRGTRPDEKITMKCLAHCSQGNAYSTGN